MEDLKQLIHDFDIRPMVAGRQMRQLLETDRAAFLESSLVYLRAATDNPGSHYLLTLLMMNGMIVGPLSDPALFSLDEAVSLARMLLRLEPLLDIKMVRSLSEVKDPNSMEELEQKAGSAKGIRLLDILGAISDGTRILPVMARLLNHPDGWVRSKAALMVGRNNKNYKWVEQRLSEPDSRVRANALESLWGVESEGSRGVFWGALADPDNRVAGNALFGLYRLGEADSIPLTLDLLKHSDADFRLTGIWVMGNTGDQRFLGVLARILADSNPKIRTAAFRAVARLKQQGAVQVVSPKLEIRVRGIEDSDAWAQVAVEVWSEGDHSSPCKEISGLKATQFALYENSLLVTHYQVEEMSHPEATAIAFAVPRVVEANDPVHASCELAFTRAIRHKRKPDSWLVLKYLPEKAPERTPAAKNTNSILQLDPHPANEVEEATLPSDLRFSTDPEEIMEAVQAAGQRMALPSGIVEAARGLLPAIAQARGARHLVLFLHPLGGAASGEDGSSAWTDLVPQARIGKVAVHCLGPMDSPDMKELCSKTGGSYWPVSSIDDIPATLEALCASMINQYLVKYRSPSLDALPSSSLKVQVYAPQGFGQEILVRAG